MSLSQIVLNAIFIPYNKILNLQKTRLSKSHEYLSIILVIAMVPPLYVNDDSIELQQALVSQLIFFIQQLKFQRMILESPKTCQHGIKYNEYTEFCYYVGCKLERRLRNTQCSDCQIHFHEDGMNNMLKYKCSSFVYDQICDLEFQIIEHKIDFDVLKEQIQYAISLIENVLFIEKMPERLIFKTLQISELLKQIQQPILDQDIKIFVQLIAKWQDITKFNSTQTTNSYQITKTHSVRLYNLFFAALSPNEKYLLLGTKNFTYLYNIQTKLNQNIYREFTQLGQFSNNSNKIISVNHKGILTIDLQSNKIQYIRSKFLEIVKQMFVFKNFLYIICQQESYNYYIRLVKFDLKSKRQIYSFNLGDQGEQVYLFNDLIAFQSQPFQFIINEKTRRTQLKINIRDYQIQQLRILNQYEMLSDNFGKIIIWNIDYQKNSLRIKQNISFQSKYTIRNIFKGNPSYGYIYIISDDELLIIDEKYKQIYSGLSIILDIKYVLMDNSSQFNSDKFFIVLFQGITLITYIIKKCLQIKDILELHIVRLTKLEQMQL